MPVARARRGPRAPRAGRRRVEIARRRISALGLSSGIQGVADLMADWQTDLGMLANLPGMTVLGVRYMLSIRAVTAAATSISVNWGLQVGDATLDAIDVDPNVYLHQDWMLLMQTQQPNLALGDTLNLVGNGDQGYAVVKSKRKLQEIQDTLLFPYQVGFAGGGTLSLLGYFAIALALP